MVDKDLIEVFSEVKDPRIQYFYALKHLHSLYAGFSSPKGLNDNERRMLNDLKKKGNHIIDCQYNDDGHVMALSLRIQGKISDFIYFPYLYWLTIRSSEREIGDYIKFIIKHGLSINLLDIQAQLITIPDLFSLTELRLLNLTKNNIEQVNWFGNLPKLEQLILIGNKIKTLKGFEKFGGYPNLKEINLSNNRISEICEFKHLSHIPNLSRVNLSVNKIKNLNISYNIPNMTHLNLSDNKIDNIIALKNLSRLKSLNLSYNKLIKLENLENLPELQYINIEKNRVSFLSGLEQLPSLLKIRHLKWKHCTKKEIDRIKEYINDIGLTVNEIDLGCFVIERPLATFEVNTHLALKLIDKNTVIFVDGERFDQCKPLLFSLSEDLSDKISDIDSIDEITYYQEKKVRIPPETEFWDHCSNLQAWYENNYDTRLIHSNMAFPLLEKLCNVGDSIAKRVFKEEIAKRFASGHPSVVEYLREEGYLNYLSNEELESF